MGGPVILDPYWGSVVLAMHMDGINGSTTFTDVKGHAVTANGSAQISTAQSKFGGASGLFNGTTDYLSTPASSNWDFVGGDFTIDFWVYTNSAAATPYQYVVSIGPDSNNNFESSLFCNGTACSLQTTAVLSGATYLSEYPSTYDIPLHTWTYVAFVKSGTTVSTFINGVLKGSNTTTGTAPTFSSVPLYIGTRSFDFTNDMNGYIDDLRITKGVARYTSNFTPPTAPFPNQ